MTDRSLIAVAVGAVAMSLIPAGSATAERIAFDRSSNQKAGGTPESRLWTIQPNGKRLRRLKTTTNVVSPDQSRDGRKLAWLRYSGVTASDFTRALVVGNRAAAHPRVLYKKRGRLAPGVPRWSPSGRALAFGQSYFNGVERIGVLDLRSKKVTTFDGLNLGGWSPDGRTIVGTSVVSSPQPSLRALDTQTGAVRTILALDVVPFDPSWSPDGSLIAFSRPDADATGPFARSQIWVVQPDGGGLRQVTTLALGGLSPSWSPNGRKLAFLAPSAERGKLHIASVGVDGSSLKRLTRDEYHLGAPDWGP